MSNGDFVSLERDLSNNYLQNIEFVLTPSAFGGPSDLYKNISGPEVLFESVSNELIGLGHGLEASLPDQNHLPALNNESSIINFELVEFFCSSAAYRTHQAIVNKNLPINLFVDHSTAIGSVTGAVCTKLSYEPNHKIALLWIDAHLDSHKPDLTPSRRAHGMPLSFLTHPKEELPPEYQKLRQSLSVPEFALPIIPATSVFHLGLSQISLCKPNFTYYSMEQVQEHGLTATLKELEKNLSTYDSVYISWDIDSIETPGTGLPPTLGFTKREAIQIANWIDIKLRRQGKLLGLDLAEFMPELDKDNQSKELAREILLKIFGETLFNNPQGLNRHLGL